MYRNRSRLYDKVLFSFCFQVELCRSIPNRSHLAGLAHSHRVVTRHTQMTCVVSQPANNYEISLMINLWCSTPKMFTLIEKHKKSWRLWLLKWCKFFGGHTVYCYQLGDFKGDRWLAALLLQVTYFAYRLPPPWWTLARTRRNTAWSRISAAAARAHARRPGSRCGGWPAFGSWTCGCSSWDPRWTTGRRSLSRDERERVT